jgi:ABC-type uncharacterized transport system fused permease/ATPase subunit
VFLIAILSKSAEWLCKDSNSQLESKREECRQTSIIKTIDIDKKYTQETNKQNANTMASINTSLYEIDDQDDDDDSYLLENNSHAKQELEQLHKKKQQQQQKQELEQVTFNWKFIKRLCRIMALISRGEFLKKFLSLVVCLLFTVGFAGLKPVAAYLSGSTLRSLYVYNLPSALRYLVYLLMCHILLALITTGQAFLTSYLSWHWRKSLTGHMLNVYFEKQNYYAILNMKDKSIDNPDQRIEADAEALCSNFAFLVVNVPSYVLNIVVTTVVLFRNGTNVFIMLAVFGFPLLSIIPLRFIILYVAKAVFAKDKHEGDFRYSQTRIREYGESMTFYRGFKKERANTEEKFEGLLQSMKSLARRNMLLDGLLQFLAFAPNTIVLVAIAFSLLKGYYPFAETSKAVMAQLVQTMFQNCNNTTNTIYTLLSQTSTLASLVGSISRVTQMLEAIDTIEKEHEDQYWLEDENRIKFDNVTFQTPSGTTLCRNLSLEINKGDHLLVMGPSGTGKSSMMRILAGLWKPSSGTIFKPRNGLFFLPQKPYLLKTATLKQQVVYPLCSDKQFSNHDVISCLQAANLSQLVTTIGLHSKSVNFDQILSLGEIQRLGMARLFLHKPKFAILDECTSALDEQNEEQVYREALRRQITLISVAHRDTVRQFHRFVCNLESDGTWSLSKINKETLVNDHVVWEKTATGTTPQLSFTEKLSEASEITGSSSFNWTHLRRFIRICYKMLPKFCSFRSLAFIGILMAAVLTAIGILAFVLGATSILHYAILRDFTWMYISISATIAGVLVFALACGLSTGIVQYCGTYWRDGLTKSLLDEYFANNMFYKLIYLDKKIDNPDQRIAVDVEAFTTGFESSGLPKLIYSAVTNILNIALFSGEAFISMGFRVPLVMLGITFLFSLFQLVIMKRVSQLIFLQDKREGDLRYTLARLKEYSEQVAFFNGKKREHLESKRKLKYALRVQWHLVIWKTILVSSSNLLTACVESLGFGLILMALHFSWLPLGPETNVIQIVAKVSRDIAIIFGMIAGIMGVGKDISKNAGAVSRIGQFMEKMDQLKTNYTELEPESSRENGPYVEFRQVDCFTPDKSQLLVSNLSLTVKENQDLIIVGESGNGKSSLLRLIGKLWPLHSGKIIAPSTIGTNGLYFLPQSPYMTNATLREQVIYPDESSTVSDEDILSILHAVQLGYIIQRYENGLDEIKEWRTVLSPGEQQRIGFARVLYHKPKYAILDEATASLDQANEDIMYRQCKESGITFISVAHRSSIQKYHQQMLSIKKGKEWNLFDRKSTTDLIVM